MTTRHAPRRPAPVLAATLVLLLALAAPAAAHVDAVTDEPAEPGAEITLGLNFQHGCAGSPTIAMAVEMPEQVDVATVEPVADGEWSAQVDGRVVEWTDGRPIPDGQEHTFEVRLTLPDTSEETLYFPTIQRCQDGEYDWIQVPAGDGDPQELEQPAPHLTLDGEPAEAGEQEEHDPPEDLDRQEAAGSEDLDPEAEPVEASPSPQATASPQAAGEADDEAESTPPWLAIGVILALAALGGVVLAATRNRSDGSAGA